MRSNTSMHGYVLAPSFALFAFLIQERSCSYPVCVPHVHSHHFHFLTLLQACTKEGCTFVVKRHSRSIDVSRQCCGLCRGKLVDVDVPTTRSNSKTSDTTLKPTPRKRAPPSAYNLFVKEQSKIVRVELMNEQKSQGVKDPKVSQSEVMKECARRWREKKLAETAPI